MTQISVRVHQPAFVFPGQGSQKVGMGVSLGQAFGVARRTWDAADSCLGFSIWALASEGPEESLTVTKNAQLALFTAEVAALRVLQDEGIRPAFVAGHSIGEYAALVAAGCFEFEEGLRLVQVRASAMDRAASAHPGTMAAILGLAADKVAIAVEEARPAGIVGIANYNAPEQIVISGVSEAVQAAGQAAHKAGARKVVALSVSGAFHSPLMQPASDELSRALEDASIAGPRIPVALNVTAAFAADADEVRTSLSRQVVEQVRWHECMLLLLGAGCDGIIEAGPGRVLSGLAKRMPGAPEVFTFDGPDDLAAIREALGAG